MHHHERRPVDRFDDLGHREGLAGSGDTQQHLAEVAAIEPVDQLGYRPLLVPFQLEVGDEFEFVVQRRHICSSRDLGSSAGGKFVSRRTDNRTTEFAAVLGYGCWVLGFWFWVLGSLGFGFAGSSGRPLCTTACMAGIKRPEDFDVWKLAWELKRRVFAFTATLPASRDRRYCDDIRRAARSGPDLVAEGYYRFNPREFHRFLNDAKASLGEVRNQLLHAKDERFISDGDFLEMLSLADRAIGAANALQAYLRSCPSKFEHRPAAGETCEPRTRNPEPAPRTTAPRT